VPVNPGYVFFHDREKVVFRNFEGKVFEYPEVTDAPDHTTAPLHEEVYTS
jgi:lysine 2,3-aminomutase